MAYAIQRIKDVPGEPRKALKGAVLLCDTSASMSWQDTWTGKRRIDHLAEVLAFVLSRTKIQVLCSFNSFVREHKLTTSVSLEEPTGGTDLALALRWCAESVKPVPEQLLLLSDGQPNDPADAVAAMAALMVTWSRPPVHCYFCGDDGDTAAKAFLASLATMGGPGSGMDTFNLATPKRLGEALVLRITHDRGARA
jgi:hypothetical protein